MPTYAVTGATGQLGRLVIEELLEHGRARRRDRRGRPQPGEGRRPGRRGVKVRKADYDDPRRCRGAWPAYDVCC